MSYKMTEEHKIKIGLALTGRTDMKCKNNSNYKDGRACKNHFCIDYGKELRKYSKAKRGMTEE